MTLATPFTGQPAERAKTAWRAGGLQFTEAGTVFLTESDRDTRMRRTWLFDGGLSGAPRKIWELRQQDRYGDPGFPIARASTGRIIQSGDDLSQRRRRVGEERSAVRRLLALRRSGDLALAVRRHELQGRSYGVAGRQGHADDHAAREQGRPAELPSPRQRGEVHEGGH
jgi:hypothetical protein